MFEYEFARMVISINLNELNKRKHAPVYPSFPLHPRQWHQRNIVASQMIGISIICSRVCSANNKEKGKARYWLFESGITRWPLHSSHKQ